MIASLTSSGPAASPPEVQKVVRAAQEFEALLLEPFLSDLQKSFSSIGGTDQQLGLSGYQDLGTQALAGGFAQGGGFGIADLIVRNLLNRGAVSKGSGGVRTKEFSQYADSNGDAGINGGHR